MPKTSIVQRADTIKVNVPLSGDFELRKTAFNLKHTTDAGTAEVVSEQFQMKQSFLNQVPGLSIVNVFNKGDEAGIELEFSAKILGNDYYEGITIDTIHRIPDIINAATFTRGGITTHSLVNESTTRRFDNTFNLRVDKVGRVPDYIEALQFSFIGRPKYGIREYGKESIELVKDTKKLQRIIIYDKTIELDEQKYKNYPVDQMTYWRSVFKDILRVELNVTTFDKMRQLWSIAKKGSISLNDILSSKENPIYKQFFSFMNIKTAQACLFNVEQMTDMAQVKTTSKKKEHKLPEFLFYEYVRLQLDKFKGDEVKLKKAILRKADLDRFNPQQQERFQKAVNAWKIKNQKVTPQKQGEMSEMLSEVRDKLEVLKQEKQTP